MKKRGVLVLVVLLCILFVAAVPQQPTKYQGYVTVDGQVPPITTPVYVKDSNNIVVGSDTLLSALGIYVADVGREGGSNDSDSSVDEGETIFFYVNDILEGSQTVNESGLTFTRTLAVSDTSYPTKPSSVGAVELSAGVVNVSWTASTDNIVIDHYKIYRGYEASFVNATPLGNTTDTNYTDSIGATGDTVYYRISANDFTNENESTSEASIELSDNIAPATPTGLAVIDEALAEGSLTISWTANTEEDISNYTLFFSANEGATWTEETETTSITYTDTGLTDGSVAYYYRVRANDESGNPSANTSNVGGVAPVDNLPPTVNVTALTATDWVADEDGINVTWTAGCGDITGCLFYRVYRDGANIANVSWGTDYYEDSTAQDGTTYEYQISIVDDAGNSGDSCAAVNGTSYDDIKPGTPTLTLVSAGNGNIEIDWSATTDSEGYALFISTTSDTYGDDENYSTTDTNYTITGLSTSTTYYMVIVGIDTDGDTSGTNNISVASNEISAMPSDRPSISASPGTSSFVRSREDAITITITSGLNLDYVNYTIYNSTPSQMYSLENSTSETSFQYDISTSNWTTDISYQINVFANDSNGQSQQTNFTYIADNTAPTFDPITANDFYTNDTTPELSFNVSDDHSSTLSCVLIIDSGTNASMGTNSSVAVLTPSSIVVNASLDAGTYEWNVNCTDDAGNTYAWQEQNFTVDVTVPVTTSDNPVGWQNAAFNIILTPSDASPITLTNYSLDGGAYSTGTTIEITTAGNHTIVFFSVDAAGNVETANIEYALLDLTAPNSTATGPSGWQNTNFNITISSDDVLSGVATSYYRFDSAVAPSILPLVNPYIEGSVAELSTDGDYYLMYYSQDNAGNNEEVKNISAKLDKTNPVCSGVVLSASQGEAGDNVTITGTCSDATSGLVSCSAYLSTDATYEVGDVLLASLGTDCDGDITIPTITDASYYIVIRAIDNATNEGTTSSAFILDSTAPVINLTSPENTTLTSSTVEFIWNVTDSLLDVDNVWYTKDGAVTKIQLTGNSSNETGFGTGRHTISFYANDTNGNIGSKTRTFVINVPLNASKELGEITGADSDFTSTDLYVGLTNHSTNTSLNANQTMRLKLKLNASGTNVTVQVPSFNGLNANWDETFTVDVSITGSVANTTKSKSGLNIMAITVLAGTTNFLPESAFDEGAIIFFDMPKNGYDILFIEQDDGSVVYKLDACANDTIPSPITLATMCYINTSTNVTLYVPHLSGGALADDTIAPIVTWTSPVNGSTIADSTFALNLTIGEANPKSTFCTYNLSTIGNGTILNSTVTWIGTTGTYEYNYTNIPDGDYYLYVNCTDLNNRSTFTDVNFTVADTTVPTVALTTSNAGTAEVIITLSATTNENATCKYATSSSVGYALMTAFTSTGEMSHSINISYTTDTTGTYYVLCNDTAGNLMSTATTIAFLADVTATVETTTTTSGSGFASFSGMVYNVDSEHTKFTLSKDDTVKFTVAGGSHSLVLNKITETQVSCTIASDPVKINLTIGEERVFDFDNNGLPEIKVVLNGITKVMGSLRADISFLELNNEVIQEPIISIKEPEPIVEVREKQPPIRMIKEFLIERSWFFEKLMIGLAIIACFVLVVYYIREHNREKKYTLKPRDHEIKLDDKNINEALEGTKKKKK